MQSLSEWFEVALAATTVEDRDRATVELARSYCLAIDAEAPLDKFGPLLLKALEALAMTPRSRLTTDKGGATNDDQPSPLDELRARRRTRAHRAAAVDATAS
ncbi:terminase small subunit [Catellatospora methionotrophica]|nr:hypothetical protein [Catellatospora methionotrophica]